MVVSSADVKSSDPGVRLVALRGLVDEPELSFDAVAEILEVIDMPLEGCEGLGSIGDVLGKTPSKGKATRILRKACREALAVVASVGDDGVNAILSRASEMGDLGLREVMKAVPVTEARDWVVRGLEGQCKEARSQAVALVHSLANAYQGSVALCENGGVLSNVVEGPVPRPELLLVLQRENVVVLLSCLRKDGVLIDRTRLARALGSFETQDDVVEALTNTAADEEENEVVREAATYAIKLLRGQG